MDVAAIAQLGERQTEDLEVPGSIPGLGIFSVQWSISLPGAVELIFASRANGRVAQWIRRPTSNRKIVGSNPIVVVFLLQTFYDNNVLVIRCSSYGMDYIHRIND